MTVDTIASRTGSILLVEDNPAHAELIQRNLRRHVAVTQVFHVGDGEAALEFLQQCIMPASGETVSLPDVILLDLRLPRMDGLQVLEIIKADPSFKAIPVVVLTTSRSRIDIHEAYLHFANSYLVKPVEFAEFAQMMRELGLYWLLWNERARA